MMFKSFEVVFVAVLLVLLYLVVKDVLSDEDVLGFVLDYLIGFVSEIEDRIDGFLYELDRWWRENT